MQLDTRTYFAAFDDCEPHDTAVAEKDLMRAILSLAMSDMKKKGEVYRDARRFFVSEEDEYIYSFLSICRFLKLCPRTVRVLVGVPPEPVQLSELAA